MTPVFLSASIPDREPYVYRCDPLAIREAILALVSVAVRDRVLVFGGHPAISPMVEHAARTLGAVQNVHIYQSLWFEDRITREARAFDNFHWTKAGQDRGESLEIMRREMIGSVPFSAGVFIGGMEGVIEECKLFRELRQGARIIPVGSTGAAAQEIWSTECGPDDSAREALRSSRHYRALFRGLLPRV